MPKHPPTTRAALDRLSISPDVPPALQSVLHAAQSATTQAVRTERATTSDAVIQYQALAFSDGTRTRVRIGKQLDGTYGIRIWDSTGTQMLSNTW